MMGNLREKERKDLKEEERNRELEKKRENLRKAIGGATLSILLACAYLSISQMRSCSSILSTLNPELGAKQEEIMEFVFGVPIKSRPQDILRRSVRNGEITEEEALMIKRVPFGGVTREEADKLLNEFVSRPQNSQELNEYIFSIIFKAPPPKSPPDLYPSRNPPQVSTLKKFGRVECESVSGIEKLEISFPSEPPCDVAGVIATIVEMGLVDLLEVPIQECLGIRMFEVLLSRSTNQFDFLVRFYWEQEYYSDSSGEGKAKLAFLIRKYLVGEYESLLKTPPIQRLLDEIPNEGESANLRCY